LIGKRDINLLTKAEISRSTVYFIHFQPEYEIKTS